MLNHFPQNVVHGCKGIEKCNICEQDKLAFDCLFTTDVGMSIKKVEGRRSVWTKTLHNLLTATCTAKKPSKFNIKHKYV